MKKKKNFLGRIIAIIALATLTIPGSALANS
jgi:hypothetical protein